MTSQRGNKKSSRVDGPETTAGLPANIGGADTSSVHPASQVVKDSPGRHKASGIKVRDLRDGKFHRIHDAFIELGYMAKVGAFGAAVYQTIVWRANRTGRAFPSYGDIAQRTGMSRRQVIRKIGELEDLGLIRVEQRLTTNGDFGTSLITLLDITDWRPIGGEGDCESPSPVTHMGGGGDSQSLPLVTHSHHPSDSQSPPLVTHSHHPSDCESPKPYMLEPDSSEPDSSEPSSSYARENARRALQNDDDDDDWADSSDALNFGPELADDTEDQQPAAGARLTPEEAVTTAALWALRQVAPDFDHAEAFIAAHGALVGLWACALLEDPKKLAGLHNPAGYVRRAVQLGQQPNGTSGARWRETVRSFEAGQEPAVEDEDPNSYEALKRKYIPAGYEHIFNY